MDSYRDVAQCKGSGFNLQKHKEDEEKEEEEDRKAFWEMHDQKPV